MANKYNLDQPPGAVTLTATEQRTLLAYLAQVGHRAGARELGISRPTVAAAASGAKVRPGTATQIRMGLSLLSSEERQP